MNRPLQGAAEKPEDLNYAKGRKRLPEDEDPTAGDPKRRKIAAAPGVPLPGSADAGDADDGDAGGGVADRDPGGDGVDGGDDDEPMADDPPASSARPGADPAGTDAPPEGDPPEPVDGGGDPPPDDAGSDPGSSSSSSNLTDITFTIPPVDYFQELQQAIDNGASPAFADYVAAVSATHDSEAGYALTHFLMMAHGTGPDWAEAWPVKAYLRVGSNHETNWADRPVSPLPRDRLEQATINWFAAVRSYRRSTAFPPASLDSVMQLDANSAAARDIASKLGVVLEPRLFNDAVETRAQWMEAMTALVSPCSGWNIALRMMDLDFGESAREEFRGALTPLLRDINPRTGFVASHVPYASPIWWRFAAVFVNKNRAANQRSWFDSIHWDAVNICGNRFKQYDLPWPSTLLMNFLRGTGTYRNMCLRLDDLMKKLREECLRSVYRPWRLYIRDIGEGERKENYESFRQMVKIVEGGRWPYTPKFARDTWLSWQNLVLTHDAGTTLNDIAFFDKLRAVAIRAANEKAVWVEVPVRDATISTSDYVWKDLQIALLDLDLAEVWRSWVCAHERLEADPEVDIESETLVWTLDLEYRTGILNGERAVGPIYLIRLEAWRSLRRLANLPTSKLSTQTRARFEDIQDRVLDFRNRFGVLLECLPIPPGGLNDIFCGQLTIGMESKMKKIADETWAQYEDFVYDQDNLSHVADRNQRRAIRKALQPRGLDYPPHEPDPQVKLRGAADADALGFDSRRSGVGNGGHWHFEGIIGSGSYGHAGLWVQFNDSGEMVERMVVKECYLDERFNNRSNWVGGIRRRVVKEDMITRNLSKLEGSGNVVASLGYAVYESRMMFRM